MLLYLVFAISGFAALLYQVVWQRSLYAIYGVNVESVTVVVTAFMLGLGLGSLAGGAISKSSRPPLALFSILELGIGAFGLVSLPLFRTVGRLTLHLPPLGTGIVTFLLVLFPTLLMGATLPLLVGHLVPRVGNVGKSVGMLYFVNTLGSACAALAAPLWLMGALGQSRIVRLAAVLNAVVSLSTYVLYRRARVRKADDALVGARRMVS